jgi:hypothetical protein
MKSGVLRRQPPTSRWRTRKPRETRQQMLLNLRTIYEHREAVTTRTVWRSRWTQQLARKVMTCNISSHKPTVPPLDSYLGIMTQMTAPAGIKKHGQKAIDALLKEFCQLDDKSVFAVVDAGTLSAKQKLLRYGQLTSSKKSATAL